MAISTVPKTKHDGTLTIYDNASAHSVEIAYENGDFNMSVPGRANTIILDRGEFPATPSVRNGDDQPITCTFTAYVRDISDASYITVEEILLNAGYFASTWVSTLGANAEKKTVKCVWTIEGTDHGDASDHTVTLAYCLVSGSIQEGDPNVLTMNLIDLEVYPTCT